MGIIWGSKDPNWCPQIKIPSPIIDCKSFIPTWGPAGNTWRGYSQLRSGREHWAWTVVVEVRQGTLGVDGRGWGPAENTVDRGSQLDEEDDEEDDEDDDDKDDKEDEEEAGGRRRQEEEATDIKSNNPHLAGREQ